MVEFLIRNQLSVRDMDDDSVFPNEFETERLRFIGPVSQYNFGVFADFMSGESGYKMLKHNYVETGRSVTYLREHLWDYMVENWFEDEAAYYI